jgi:hypothetical protein
MDDQNSLSLTSLSPLYRFVNVLYNWTIFLLMNTFLKEWLRLVTLCDELHYIISFDLYTLSMTVIDATERNVSVSHFLNILALFIPMNTFWHVWPRLVTLCNVLLYINNFVLIPTLRLFLMQTNTMSQFLTFFNSGLYFYCWTRFDTNGHA